MFVAVCKNKLLTCAKRRILRFASNTAAQLSAFPSSNVRRGALASRWKDISTKTVRKEKSLLTIFKNSLCCLGQWPNQMHFPAERLRRQKSTFSIGLSGFWKAWSAPTLPSNLKTTKPDSFGQIRGRTDYYISHASSSLHSLSRAHLSPYVNCLFHFNVKSGISQGYRGYSSSSGKPDGKEVSAKQVVSTDSVVSPRSDSQSVANQGFHFKELYENPWTIPNFLCMARIALAPVLGYLIVEQYFHLSLALFTLAGATDLLDGYIARNWPNQKSVLGSALDPLADKILISVLYISLTYASLIPAPLTALVISRDVALIAAVFYVRYKTVPPPASIYTFFTTMQWAEKRLNLRPLNVFKSF